MMIDLLTLLALIGNTIVESSAQNSSISATVQLDEAIFHGVSDGVANRFLGIPFAKPPVANLRLRPPVPNDPYVGNISATSFGSLCPQQLTNITIPDTVSQNVSSIITTFTARLFAPRPGSEDCLFLNVWAPVGINSSAGLPVVAWIPGGGFETSGASEFNGTVIVQRSLELGEPIIFVSLNYRLNAFGFLPGKEVKAAGIGNLGLLDQRQAFRWIQTYIRAFGGDPTKVTIAGQSAGGESVALQLLAYGGNTEGLFRGAIMESGSPMPIGDIANGQQYYDALVEQTGCFGSTDTLECLRWAPFEELMIAVNSSPSIMSYQSVVLAWVPRADGLFLPDTFQRATMNGKIANVPFMIGDVDDEGTVFAVAALNVTTDEEFRTYASAIFFPNASESDINTLAKLYPADPAAGSPFDTGLEGAFTPQFKRLSALIGDLIFQAPRRLVSQVRSDKQDIWAYLMKRSKTATPFGSVHGTDIGVVFRPGDLTDNVINFINHLDPNGPHSTDGELTWPKYTNDASQLLTFIDGPMPQIITNDTFRLDATNFLTGLTLAHPLGGP
ncbi:unnamed protein product [Somion occarium]|uniref:Carboxylic ester hydrolase n=1 Tax=Somion occarium TaxID=3059160 RepID=A0ABP1DKZ4_9APHY